MKKTVSTLLVVVFSISLVFGRTSRQWEFQLNKNGKCVVERVYPTHKGAYDAFCSIKKTLNRHSLDGCKIINENPNKCLVYAIKKNTTRQYTPQRKMFMAANGYIEEMQFKMSLSYNRNAIVVKMYDFVFASIDLGYAYDMQISTFEQVISEYSSAQKVIATGTRKERKEAKDIVEAIDDSFNECQEELDDILHDISKHL